jgi:RNA polymerase sigma-70 factor (ECF subfamily)
MRVAYNAAIDRLRREHRTAIVTDVAAAPDACESRDELADDELRMIFLCCHPAISHDSRVALSLKTVGGFSAREIAHAFRVEEVAVTRRLSRARREIRARGLSLDAPLDASERLDAVLDVLYFMFNEGYGAMEGEDLIRRDLCLEALRLGQLIAASPIATPRAHALVALMALQAARLAARVDAAGDLVLLEDQDRRRWDHALLALGLDHFRRAMDGDDEPSSYHVQAAIAVAYSAATDARAIDWRVILKLYDHLLAIDPSPIVALNRAVVLSKVEGPAAALDALDAIRGDRAVRSYHRFEAVRGQLLAQVGRARDAAQAFEAALAGPCSEPERRFLRAQLKGLTSANAR